MYKHCNCYFILSDTYSKARRKARDAEDTSDLLSEAESSRKRKKTKRFISSETEDSDESMCFPSPPPMPEMKKENEAAATEADSSSNSQEDTTLKYLKIIIQQQHLQRALLTDILGRVEALEQRISKVDTVPEGKRFIFVLPIVYPINTSEDMSLLENYLQDDGNFKDAVTELSQTGGSVNYNFIKRVLTLILSNQLAMGYSWMGRKGKQKFNSTNVAKVLIEAAQQMGLGQVKKDTETSIMLWLRRAAERTRSIAKNL
ncbi:uncharacterized protein LOC128879469 isoform X2 [Hylaeus volcanicus]|uniref:uncharacterized protein LOC128879469 isoform X2 n=1 Tax=Hylaeus volcanicus TaxID=313075 RepID=UPI0023B7CF3F|nr:uncharacterized protein LOC128879469 isoform X2 [Hylaeus volcanicus]